MNATVTPSQVIATICNRRQNSDVRADDLEVRFLLDKAFAEERAVSDALLAALKEAWCWVPDGTRQTPEQRGAKCETASDMNNLINNAIYRAEPLI